MGGVVGALRAGGPAPSTLRVGVELQGCVSVVRLARFQMEGGTTIGADLGARADRTAKGGEAGRVPAPKPVGTYTLQY